MEASSKYNKWSAWIKWNKYVTSILTKDEVLEMEKWHEITIDDPDYPIYASIKKYWKWYLIESIDNNLYIETWMIQNWKWINCYFRYRLKEYYIQWYEYPFNFTRLPWTWREIYILKICATYYLSAEIISEIILRSKKTVIKKAKELKINIKNFELKNTRSEGLIKYYEIMEEMYEKWFKYERTKYSYYWSKPFNSDNPLIWSQQIPYKDLGYFYK